MQLELTDREQEIMRLHEMDKVSFRALGEKYGISPSRASRIFCDADRKRRMAYQKELQREENKKEISLILTKGDLLQLRDMLEDFAYPDTGEQVHG